MEKDEREKLIDRMGSDIQNCATCMRTGEWPLARMYLNRFFAGAGMFAMEVDENDPVEREN